MFLLNKFWREKHIKLIIVGSPEVMNNRQEHDLITKLNSWLILPFEKEKIPFINLCSKNFKDMLGPDKVHYNETGHLQLAKSIEEKIIALLFGEAQTWMQSILSFYPMKQKLFQAR